MLAAFNRSAAVLSAAFGGSLALSAASPAQPVIHDACPDVSPCHAVALSADGSAMVGQSGIPFRWKLAGGHQSLVTPGWSGQVFGVSGDGEVAAGTAWTTALRAFRWTQAGGMQVVHPAGWSLSYGGGVSADGSVMVGAMGNSGMDRAFRWTAGGVQDLGQFNGGPTAAYGVSADGTVVVGEGWANGALLWSGGTWQSLGRFTGGNTAAGHAVSDDGTVVVGRSGSSAGDRAFRWTQGPGMQSLGLLPGASSSVAWDLTSDGSTVVGTSGDRAFLWTAETGIVDLNAHLVTLGFDLTGWVLNSAVGISADGSAIAGTGLFNGQQRAWVATGIGGGEPCPPDWNGDGEVNSSDISAYLTAWLDSVQNGNLIADFDGGGSVNSSDISAFLAAWLQAVQFGC